jgi:hypothetical protein
MKVQTFVAWGVTAYDMIVGLKLDLQRGPDNRSENTLD